MSLKEIAIHELEQSAYQTLERITRLRQSSHAEDIENLEADARVLQAKANSLATELELEAEAELVSA